MIYLFALVIGACVGSFLCCQVRRMQLKSVRGKKLPARSVCMYCKKQLKWYENVPVVSWLVQKGKCRHCGRKIGTAELLSEVLTAVAFVAITVRFAMGAENVWIWPVMTGSMWGWLVFELIFVSVLMFLAIYDACYGELPFYILILAVFLSVIKIILGILPNILAGTFEIALILNPLMAGLMLGGIYLSLYSVSHGAWVGDGDWLLALAIALALGTPFKALLVLLISNLSATLIMWPVVRKTGSRKIYFGPFLVLAYVIIVVCIG